MDAGRLGYQGYKRMTGGKAPETSKYETAEGGWGIGGGAKAAWELGKGWF